MELTVTNRSRAYPGRSSGDSKVDDVQYVVLKVCTFYRQYSSIAQSVEHAAVNRAVVGSSPTRGVYNYKNIVIGTFGCPLI